ncbi:hypothetical protein QR680_006782 [Steinernema hermaphroditum]|uniref:Uncharacterized protein n=1 Tax=Steinernema hermaphroditum TaxID=289476 RepID=A0AA39LXM9_9BILA|nr:hypothetical protein QR680_006782 [Steinernema hermaphroditum]
MYCENYYDYELDFENNVAVAEFTYTASGVKHSAVELVQRKFLGKFWMNLYGVNDQPVDRKLSDRIRRIQPGCAEYAISLDDPGKSRLMSFSLHVEN